MTAEVIITLGKCLVLNQKMSLMFERITDKQSFFQRYSTGTIQIHILLKELLTLDTLIGLWKTCDQMFIIFWHLILVRILNLAGLHLQILLRII